jgi:hypothetical protein
MPSSTILLSRTIALTQQFVRNAPLTFTDNTDPALANADWVRQFMLSAPFAWRWNRTVTTFPTIVNQQDYSVSVPTFGWIEKATFFDSTESTNPVRELEVRLVLADNKQSGQPMNIAAQLDDGAGNITFRLMPVPNEVLTVSVISQNACPIFTAPTQTWAPIPDYLQYLCSQGMLAKAYEYLGDERYPMAMQMFLRQVIAANGGLDETQVNIFLADRLNTQRETQEVMGNAQSARQGRGAF